MINHFIFSNVFLQIQYIDQHHIITISERNSFCWNLQEAEPKRVYQVKGLPDCSAVMNANSIFMHTFEDPTSAVAGYQDAAGSQGTINVLYCLAGHKISAGDLHKKGSGDKRSGGGKEVRENAQARLCDACRCMYICVCSRPFTCMQCASCQLQVSLS
jgi:hypothetical protein